MNKLDFSSIMFATEGMTYPLKCFRQAITQYLRPNEHFSIYIFVLLYLTEVNLKTFNSILDIMHTGSQDLTMKVIKCTLKICLKLMI